MDEQLKLSGHISWVLTRADGTIERGENHNIVTTAGKQWLVQYLTAASPPANMGWLAFGTSSTTPAATDVGLGAELTNTGYTRVSATKSNSGQVAQYQGTLQNVTGGLPVTIQEVGLFNASGTSGGTMFNHALTGAITLNNSSDTLQMTLQITQN